MKASEAPNMIHKNMSVSGVKVLDEEQGIVEAFVSGIGNKDSVGDIIQPGAFVRSLSTRKPKGVWAHDWSRPVSKTIEAYEVEAGSPQLPDKMKLAGIGGLYVKTQFNLNTEDGRYAFENVKFYDDESEWSIGYNVVKSEYDKKQKALLLLDIELFEYSPVLFGANPLTSTLSVKVADGDGNMKADISLSLEGDGDDDDIQRIATAIKNALSSSEEDLEVQITDEKTDAVSQEEESVVLDGEEAPVVSEQEEDKTEDEKEDETEAEKSGEVEESEKSEVETTEGEKSESVEVETTEIQPLTDEEKAEIHKKALVGSLEELRQELSEAVRASFGGPDTYVYVYATFEDSVIYEEYDYRAGEQAYYQVSYEKEDDGYEFGTPVEVDVVEVVVAKKQILETIAKGHGDALRSVLAPLAEKAVETAAFFDVDVAKALLGIVEEKAGRSLSKATAGKIQGAIDILSELINTTDGSEDAEEKEEAPEVELKTEEAGDESAPEETHVEVIDAAELQKELALLLEIEEDLA